MTHNADNNNLKIVFYLYKLAYLQAYLQAETMIKNKNGPLHSISWVKVNAKERFVFILDTLDSRSFSK